MQILCHTEGEGEFDFSAVASNTQLKNLPPEFPNLIVGGRLSLTRPEASEVHEMLHDGQFYRPRPEFKVVTTVINEREARKMIAVCERNLASVGRPGGK